MIYKIYGPPGTGKTYTLIEKAKEYLDLGTPPHKIGYFAFTRKAAKEALSRMPLEPKKLVYFQTLHSFAYHQLSLNDTDIMQPYHYEDLGKQLNIKVKYHDKYNDEEIHYLTCDNEYFQLIGRAINRDITIREEFDRGEHDKKNVKWSILKHIDANFKEYKTANKLNDFNDIIKRVIEKDKLPQFEVVFIDEAQDLSPLQWKLYDKLKEYTNDIYLAGDDDQAIFGWAGADVDRFITEPAEETVLEQSQRIARQIQEESIKPIENIRGLRKQKEYLPKDEEGHVSYISNFGQVDLSKGKWLILARTSSKLIELMKELKKENYYFQSNKGRSYNRKIYKAAINYTLFCKGEEIAEKYLKDIHEFTENKIDKSKPWYEAFTNANQKEINYIRILLEKGEDLDSDARIWFSTIHTIKGGESDNVILSLHQGSKVQKSIKRSIEKSDEENRVWYVAITRAKYNLYKLKTKDKRKEYII